MNMKNERDVQAIFMAIAAQLSYLLDANIETVPNKNGAKMTVKIMCDTGVIPILSTDYHQIFCEYDYKSKGIAAQAMVQHGEDRPPVLTRKMLARFGSAAENRDTNHYAEMVAKFVKKLNDL